MVKDLNELQQEAAKWASNAIGEVQSRMVSFMREKDASVEEIAEVLGWKPKKVQAIVDGLGDLRITDLATLLVATNQVLHILPAQETPISYGSIPDVVEAEVEEEKPFGETPEWDSDEDEDNEDEDNEKEEVPQNCKQGFGIGLMGIDLKNNPDAAKFISNMQKVLKESGMEVYLKKIFGEPKR